MKRICRLREGNFYFDQNQVGRDHSEPVGEGGRAGVALA